MTPPKKKQPYDEYETMDWKRFTLEAGRTWGVPTVIVGVLLYCFMFQIVPAFSSAMKEYVEANNRTQDAIIATQKDTSDNTKSVAASMANMSESQAILSQSQVKLVQAVQDIKLAADEIVETERATQVFMVSVKEEHTQHSEEHKVILDAVEN